MRQPSSNGVKTRRPGLSNKPSVGDGLSKAGRVTPLAIILSFVLLTEIVVMVGVIGTSSTVQLILTIFCVSFPPFIAIPFFFILYTRPIVFYAPGDFGEKLKPQDFAAAVASRHSAKLADTMSEYIGNLEGKIAVAISSTEQLKNLIARQGGLDGKQIEDGINIISREIASEIENADIIKFDLTSVGGKNLSVPITGDLNVSDVLDFIYFEICRTMNIPAYEYERVWVLQNTATGKILRDIGSTWAEKSGFSDDNRRPRDVGLLPGEIYKVILLD